MELNNRAIGTIKSKHLKEYLHSINKVFTPEEQVTIIYNSDLTLLEKEQTFIEYLCNGEIEDWFKSEDELNQFRIKINKILKGITLFNNLLNMQSTVIMFDDPLQYNNTCARNIKDIQNIYKKASEKEESEDKLYDADRQISLIHLDTSTIIAWAEINSNAEVVRYDFVDEALKQLIGEKSIDKIKSGLEDKYVDVPNDFKVGDVVTVCGSQENTEYVVTAESELPEHLRDISDYSVDASVTVVPKQYFKGDKPYKEQVEDIIKEKVANFKNGSIDDMDIITVYHEHIHLTLIEKQ
jgi:hypothetical protein